MARAGQWCILRMAAARTLSVAKSLARDGFDVWTPVEVRQQRRARSRERVEKEIALMPTYVFAPAERLRDLVSLSVLQFSPYPDFTVFRYQDRFPVIADETLRPLRIAERKGTPLEKVRKFTQGERVKLLERGFEGLSGIVETDDGKFALVCFPGFNIPIKVASMHLLTDEPQSETKVVQAA